MCEISTEGSAENQEFISAAQNMPLQDDNNQHHQRHLSATETSGSFSDTNSTNIMDITKR
jgi:hypothetical protein